MNNEKDHWYEKYKTTIRDCKILYKKNHCHWEVKNGWYDLLSEFSYLCEEINIRFYKKYRYRISMDQVKQKYGILRIYATVEKDPCCFITYINDIIYKLISKLDTLDYKFKKINHNNFHSNYLIEIYDTEDEFIKDIKCGSNVTTSKIKDKFIKTIKNSEYTIPVYKPTKLQILYYIKKGLEKISNWLFGFPWIHLKKHYSAENNVIFEYINLKLDKLISKYEHKSENICEECGYVINKKYDSVCYTTGWITTLCKSCAKKSGNEYEMDGKIYCNGIFIKDVQ